MCGKLAKMFPGQKHHDLALFLGLQVYRQSFEGLEAGLRAKVLVIAACTLQYNVFRWLETMPRSLLNEGILQEPCPLFVSPEDVSSVPPTSNENNRTLPESSSSDFSAQRARSNSWPLKSERFEMQKTTLKVYLKFWMENMFNLFGLEINMIALLLSSFALLNAISMFYIACLATCVLLGRPIIRKLWPVFVFLFATILLAEYFAMWKNVMTGSMIGHPWALP
ncbi:UNVERIFIED_CONTAM: Piezo-type mechanosensitive ion channel [Sesamum radiatum]|uniref:Piezo-type mechanosensitive ion channel n=1 Tax=Sesamum radiatum TaxID=300843 RepID=A0AAW2W8A2_SESRA